MVSSYLMGGLGNQLFQIATGMSLAIDNCVDFSVNIKDGVFTHKTPFAYKDVFYSKINLNGTQSENQYKEKQFKYTPIPYSDNIQLFGYFQSEKYFKHNRYHILKTFENEKIIQKLLRNYNWVLKNSVSLHVRRGDYLSIQNVHPCQSLEYYKYCLSELEKKTNIEHILVFSDDIDWCIQNFKDDRITFICGLPDYEDLILMSLCNHNIIANSSFSWWGAWMNKNKEQYIYAPSKWFGSGYMKDWSDIYSENMIIV